MIEQGLTDLELRIYAELHRGSFSFSMKIATAMEHPYDDEFREALNQLVDKDYVGYGDGLQWILK